MNLRDFADASRDIVGAICKKGAAISEDGCFFSAYNQVGDQEAATVMTMRRCDAEGFPSSAITSSMRRRLARPCGISRFNGGQAFPTTCTQPFELIFGQLVVMHVFPA